MSAQPRVWIPRLRFRQAVILTALATVSVLLNRNIDFRVYWYGVRDFFAGVRPAYGPLSGIGAPMDYLYPPATYLLLYPIQFLSLRVAGMLWTLVAFVSIATSAITCVRIWRLRFRVLPITICCALMLPYLALSVRYGNVQSFAVPFILMALALSKDEPLLSGFLLSLAVTFKVTPVFFLPWFIRRRETLFFFCASMLVLWSVPFLVFGVHGYPALLRDWYLSLTSLGHTASEFHYFPGQSLRSLCLRFLSPVDPPISGYPKVNIASLSPASTVRVWEGMAGVIYAIAIVCYSRSSQRTFPHWAGLAFVLYSMLAPFVVKVSLLSLGPAALIGAALLTENSSRSNRSAHTAGLCYMAAGALSLGSVCVGDRHSLRLLQTLGIDFWISCLLAVAYTLWIRGATKAPENRTPLSA